MRMIKLDARQSIAEGVDLVTAPERRRFHTDRMLQALLERRRTRHEMQQVMGMQHVAGVRVDRFVMDAIAHALAHVHTDWESPVCEK